MSRVIAAYGQVTTGYWPAVIIGAMLLLALIATTIVAVRSRRHRRRAATPPTSAAPSTAVSPEDADVPHERCRVLIAEALIVRDRVSGRIDAATYQARMTDLVSERHEGTDHVEC